MVPKICGYIVKLSINILKMSADKNSELANFYKSTIKYLEMDKKTIESSKDGDTLNLITGEADFIYLCMTKKVFNSLLVLTERIDVCKKKLNDLQDEFV